MLKDVPESWKCALACLVCTLTIAPDACLTVLFNLICIGLHSTLRGGTHVLRWWSDALSQGVWRAVCVATGSPAGSGPVVKVMVKGGSGWRGALQLFALVQRGGVLGGAFHGQSRHVAQSRQQLQCLGARGRRFHGWGCASWGEGHTRRGCGEFMDTLQQHTRFVLMPLLW